jgi:hypothetical protein
LTKCAGNEIWSVSHCLEAGIPEVWIEELSDVFESGFQNDSQTIYVGNDVTNQYHGVRDLDLAIRIARSMGLDVDRVTAMALTRQAIVQAIKDAVMDGD